MYLRICIFGVSSCVSSAVSSQIRQRLPNFEHLVCEHNTSTQRSRIHTRLFLTVPRPSYTHGRLGGDSKRDTGHGIDHTRTGTRRPSCAPLAALSPRTLDSSAHTRANLSHIGIITSGITYRRDPSYTMRTRSIDRTQSRLRSAAAWLPCVSDDPRLSSHVVADVRVPI